MTAEPCPNCKGRCCRDEFGYRVVHMGAEHYQHDCDACEDGTKYVPPRTAEDERADVVAWLRENPAQRALTIYESIGCIERGEHVGAAKGGKHVG